jgi:hypothetical protein
MKDSTIGRRALLIALAAGFAVTGNLFAYETKYTDKKTDEKTENNTEFKVDGVIFAGYERTDKENSGVPDANGTNARNQGFDIKRAYLNLIGNVTDGDYKGYGFRVTFDGGQVLGGTAATTSASGNNIHVPELKFAYMTMPLFSAGDFGSSSLRLGMQHTPTTFGTWRGSGCVFARANRWAAPTTPGEAPRTTTHAPAGCSRGAGS